MLANPGIVRNNQFNDRLELLYRRQGMGNLALFFFLDFDMGSVFPFYILKRKGYCYIKEIYNISKVLNINSIQLLLLVISRY